MSEEVKWRMSRVRTVDGQREVISHATIDGLRLCRIRVHNEPFTPAVSEVFYSAGRNASFPTAAEALEHAKGELS